MQPKSKPKRPRMQPDIRTICIVLTALGTLLTGLAALLKALK